jgi:superfamily II DNA or RNA helicase
MSCYVARKDLTETMIKSITKDLWIVPQKKSYIDMYQQPEEPIKFYRLDTVNGDIKGIFLPYAYSAGLIGKHINHLKTYPVINFTCTSTLRDDQPSTYKELFTDVMTKGSAILNVPPGFGKTVIGSKLVADAKHPAAVLTHLVGLVNQWVTTFRNTLVSPTGKPLNIWVVGEGPMVGTPEIIICMDQRVKNIPKEIKDTIGTLIIDEAHCFCTDARAQTILEFSPKYVVAETATLKREDSLHSIIHMLCGPKAVYRAITKVFKVFKVDTGIELETQKNSQGKLDWAFLVNKMCENEKRNDIIVNIIKSNPTKKILVLTSRTEHIKILEALLGKKYGTVDTFYGTKRSYVDSRILLGTISKIGTGFDEGSACKDFKGERINLVIMATSIKNESLLEQCIGRGFRSEFPEIYDIVDRNRTLKSHYYIRNKWYASKNGVVANAAGVTVRDDGPDDGPDDGFDDYPDI